MPRIHPAVRTAFRVTGHVAPPLALAASLRAFRTVGPPSPVRDADRATHERARRGALRIAGEQAVTYAWGDPAGPPVLLVHGWRSRASRFARLVEDLEARGHRVLSYDALAHGESTGRYTTILDHLAIIRRIQESAGRFAGVVGHSFGALAAGVALAEGLRAATFTAIATAPSFDALNQSFVDAVDLPPALHARHSAQVASRIFPHEPDPADRFDLLRHPVPTPALFVHGDRDREVPPAVSRALHEAHPGSRLVITPDSHNRVLDGAEARAAIVDHISARAVNPA